MKNVSYFIEKNPHGLLDQPDIRIKNKIINHIYKSLHAFLSLPTTPVLPKATALVAHSPPLLLISTVSCNTLELHPSHSPSGLKDDSDAPLSL